MPIDISAAMIANGHRGSSPAVYLRGTGTMFSGLRKFQVPACSGANNREFPRSKASVVLSQPHPDRNVAPLTVR
jgi:hypothetical protein